MKLTAAQTALLVEVGKAAPRSKYAVQSYAPVKKLLSLGLIEPATPVHYAADRWVLTAAGRTEYDQLCTPKPEEG